eukprot:6208740-Pleurochrysis_carterae.AAC.2
MLRCAGGARSVRPVAHAGRFTCCALARLPVFLSACVCVCQGVPRRAKVVAQTWMRTFESMKTAPSKMRQTECTGAGKTARLRDCFRCNAGKRCHAGSLCCGARNLGHRRSVARATHSVAVGLPRKTAMRPRS